MWELDCEEGWTPKNWCFWTVVLERTLESPLECEEVQLVHPKGSQSWVFFWRTDAKAETPMLWPPHAKSWLIGKDSDTGRDWGQEEKVTTEDEMVGWHHRLYGHEFEWTPGVGDGQGGLACCDSWGCKESDMTESLKWTELSYLYRWEKFFFRSFLIPWMFISNSIFCQPFICLSWCLWNHFAFHTPLLFFTCLLCKCPESILICTAIKRMNHHLFSNAHYLKFYFHS